MDNRNCVHQPAPNNALYIIFLMPEHDRPAPTSRADLLPHLARSLYETMDRLDPSPDTPRWEDISDMDRDLYRVCVEEVLGEADYWRSRIPATTTT